MKNELTNQNAHLSDYPHCGNLISSTEETNSGSAQENDEERAIENFFENLRLLKNLNKIGSLLKPFEAIETNPNSPYLFEQIWYVKDDVFKEVFGIDKSLFSQICQRYPFQVNQLLEPYVLKYTDWWDWEEYSRCDGDNQESEWYGDGNISLSQHNEDEFFQVDKKIILSI